MDISVPFTVYFCIAGATLCLQTFVALARRRVWIANGKTAGLRPYANVMTNITMYTFVVFAGMIAAAQAFPVYGVASFWTASLILFGVSAVLFWSYRKDKLG